MYVQTNTKKYALLLLDGPPFIKTLERSSEQGTYPATFTGLDSVIPCIPDGRESIISSSLVAKALNPSTHSPR